MVYYPLLPIIALALTLLTSLPSPVEGDAYDDLWTQYMQQTEAAKYESTVSRRERNLDHWDVPTAAAYLGLHPETLKPLPTYASSESSTDTSSSSSTSTSTSTTSSDLTDEYVGHDAAILFYAQWCHNCHAVAPSWDAIATHMNAGTRSSNLVMALFDCEKNAKATELCVAAGIRAYPTMMYVGSGEYHDTDLVTSGVLGRDRSAGPFGATTLRRTVKFQGNWQYGDQILDWVRIMGGLSSWHSVVDSGPLRGLRDGLFRFVTGGKYKGGRGRRGGITGEMGKGGSLPVGVPPNFQTELRGMASGSSAAASAAVGGASEREVEELKEKLNATNQEKELYTKAVTHSSLLIDQLLFSNVGSSATRRDPFAILSNSNGWHANATTLPAGAPADEHPSILRSCTLELTIDYCTRVTSRCTSVYLEELGAIPDSDPFPTIEEIETRLYGEVKREEPYCGLVESCMASDFEGEGCRVAECPFENKAACAYVESCLDPKIQDEYGLALGLISEGEKVMNKDWSSVAGSSSEEGASAGEINNNAGVGGWGIPAS